jgi:putative N6-adenine-specific DNA methylase
MSDPFEIFLAAPPGLEDILHAEAMAHGFGEAAVVPGGVSCRGHWADVWRANLLLRGAGRVLVRLGAFHAVHLAQLDKRARRIDWSAVFPSGSAARVDATCEKSRIYHAGAAAQRVARAMTEGAGVAISPDATARVLVRIVDDHCTISLDTSGEPLHRRGFKQAVGKAPLRETLAALFLCAAGYDGREPVVDPMCGSGTFVLEAAEMAAGLAPGRARSFAFEGLAGFDPEQWAEMRARPPSPVGSGPWIGHDRDAGAVAMATDNARRACVDATFSHQPVSALRPPAGAPPGLVIINPPYGARIGDVSDLRALYGAFGRVMRERFAGWRVAVVTSEATLAHATGLPFDQPGPPVPHGKLRVRLWRAGPL